MPKMKTRKSISKRFKITKNGKGNKVKRRMAFKNHLKSQKSKDAKRSFRKPKIMAKGDAKKVKIMMPYGK